YAAVHEVAGSVHRRLRISEHYGKDRDHRVPRQLDAMLLELLAEKVRPVPKRGRQLRTLALQDPEARQAAGSNHRRDVRREERWTSTVSDELDQVSAARDVAPDTSESLAQRTHVQRDRRRREPVMLTCPPPARTQHTEGVSVVKDQQRPLPPAHLCDFRQRREAGIHAEDSLR